MSDEKDKIITKEDTLKIGLSRAGAVHQVGLGAKIQKAREEGSILQNTGQKKNRIFICLDDSGSMDDYIEKAGTSRMEQAKEAVKGFLTACSAVDTVVGIHAFSSNKVYPMTPIYPILLRELVQLQASGCTPLYQSIEIMSQDTNKPTRIVAISDGSPDEFYNEDNLITMLEGIKELCPVDAVFIGDENETDAIRVMKQIADLTGGRFIHFKPGTSFAENFKYLAPAYYGLLADPSFVKKIEG